VSHEEAWTRYIEGLALLTKAERRTAAAREALHTAESQEDELRRRGHQAREELDAIAKHEAGGLWVSLDQEAETPERIAPSTAPTSDLVAVEAPTHNGHVGVLRDTG
jgi:hypothetical protein